MHTQQKKNQYCRHWCSCSLCSLPADGARSQRLAPIKLLQSFKLLQSAILTYLKHTQSLSTPSPTTRTSMVVKVSLKIDKFKRKKKKKTNLVTHSAACLVNETIPAFCSVCCLGGYSIPAAYTSFSQSSINPGTSRFGAKIQRESGQSGFDLPLMDL